MEIYLFIESNIDMRSKQKKIRAFLLFLNVYFKHCKLNVAGIQKLTYPLGWIEYFGDLSTGS
jgi:hypothetical protein